MVRILAVLITAVLLFGCGGDDKSSESPASMPESDSNLGVVLNERAALSISDVHLNVQRFGAQTLQTDCGRDACTVQGPISTPVTVPISEIRDPDTSSIENLREQVNFIEEKRGVEVYSGSVGFDLGDNSVDAPGYGGWMVHNYFLAVWGDYSGPTIPSAEVGVGLSVGNATGSHPTADATYNGVMLGVITAEGGNQGNGVEGDATLEFSTANPGGAQMDVSFTNITNRETSGTLSDITWNAIQVRADGTFDTGDIHGIFYGSAHEEVGGTFNKDNVAGAFGAAK